MKNFDLKMYSVIFVTLFIAAIIGYMLFSVISVGDTIDAEKTEQIEKILDKALVHCYALEGSYPSDIHELSRYGVVFDEEKYIYYYDIYGANLKPEVTIIAKE